MKNNDFEVKPCMIATENKCADFGTVCCNTLEDRQAFNNYVDKNGLPKSLKFSFNILYVSSGDYESNHFSF